MVKGKSMLSEEIGLNERLEADGVEVFETDLGEFIIQLAGRARPSTSSRPAIHWSRERRCANAVRAAGGRAAGRTTPTELVGIRPRQLRGAFLAADVGITGVNFGVAETGTVVIVTNEGNGRLTTTHAAGAHRADRHREGGARSSKTWACCCRC